jgi:hypothetical protein
MNAFYANLRVWHSQRGYTSIVLTRAEYDERVSFINYLLEGGNCRAAFVAGTSIAYKSANKYHVVTAGKSSKVLVLRPEDKPENKKGQRKRRGAVDVMAMRLEDLQQPTYVEKLFSDLWKIHKDNHCKGLSLFTCAKAPKDWYFESTCVRQNSV